MKKGSLKNMFIIFKNCTIIFCIVYLYIYFLHFNLLINDLINNKVIETGFMAHQ